MRSATSKTSKQSQPASDRSDASAKGRGTTAGKSRAKGKRPASGTMKSLKTGLSSNVHNGRLRIMLGVLLAGLTLTMALVLISYLFTAGADQSLVQGAVSPPIESTPGAEGSTTAPEGQPAENLIGRLGAILGDLLFNGLFGVGSFALVYIVGVLTYLIFRRPAGSVLRFVKHFVVGSFWAIWLSVVAASLDRLVGYEGALIWGGKHGEAINDLLTTHLGVLGLIITLVLSLFVALLLTWDKFLFAIRDAEPPRIDTSAIGDKTSGLWSRLTRRHAGQADDNSEDLTPDDEDSPYEDEPSEPEGEVSVSFAPDAPLAPTSERTDSSEHTPLHASAIPTEGASSTFVIEEAPETELAEPSTSLEEEAIPEGVLLASYRKPDLDLLREYEQGNKEQNREEIEYNKQRILDTLLSFKIQATPHKATIGPTVTLYEVIPAQGVKLSRITGLENDLALALKSEGIRIIAPIPGSGTVGIEVPNSRPQTVSMRSVLASKKFSEMREEMELPIGIGKTITNEPFIFDLARMPHMLIAGATGQGKSVGLNAMITSLLYSKRPEELKFILVDPKMLEFSIYREIEKHFLAKLPDAEEAIITDMSKVVPTLNSLCVEMDRRYRLMSQVQVRNIKEYNALYNSGRLLPEEGYEPMQYMGLIGDEFADLIMTSGREVEQPIARLAQKARAAGIHMVIATQRPSTDVITGLIKANFPARIAFRVFSSIDSRTILDSVGANQLIGRGDMLFYQGKEMIRIQCAFLDTPETERLVAHIASQASLGRVHQLPEYVPETEGSGPKEFNAREKDVLFEEVARMIVNSGVGSTSNIQRKFEIGYNRAGRLMDQLEAAGIVSPADGSKAREVLIKDPIALEALLERL